MCTHQNCQNFSSGQALILVTLYPLSSRAQYNLQYIQTAMPGIRALLCFAAIWHSSIALKFNMAILLVLVD